MLYDLLYQLVNKQHIPVIEATLFGLTIAIAALGLLWIKMDTRGISNGFMMAGSGLIVLYGIGIIIYSQIKKS